MKSFCRLLIAFVGVALVSPLVSGDGLMASTRLRQCYACNGLNCSRTSMMQVTTQCSDPLDICVTIFKDYNVEARGCYLEIPEEQRFKCEDGENPECFKCFGELCNNVGRIDFQCIVCESDKSSRCANDTSKMKPQPCPIPTAPNSYCYVNRTATGVIQRGCLTQVIEQLRCFDSDECAMCLSKDGEACNALNASMDAATGRFPLSFGALATSFVALLSRYI